MGAGGPQGAESEAERGLGAVTAGELEAAAVENDGQTGRQEKDIVILSALGPQTKGLGCPDRLCQQPSLNQGPKGPEEHCSLREGGQ